MSKQCLSAACTALFLGMSAIGVGSAAPAYAADELNVSKGATLAGPGLAARGYDVVSYFTDGKPVLGSDKYAIAVEGATYRFASQDHLNEFQADPDKYRPAFGGYCAYGAALGKKFDGDPNLWKIVDGKLYFNLNQDIVAEWRKDIPGNIEKANENWKTIEPVAVEDL